MFKKVDFLITFAATSLSDQLVDNFFQECSPQLLLSSTYVFLYTDMNAPKGFRARNFAASPSLQTPTHVNTERYNTHTKK